MGMGKRCVCVWGGGDYRITESRILWGGRGGGNYGKANIMGWRRRWAGGGREGSYGSRILWGGGGRGGSEGDYGTPNTMGWGRRRGDYKKPNTKEWRRRGGGITEYYRVAEAGWGGGGLREAEYYGEAGAWELQKAE